MGKLRVWYGVDRLNKIMKKPGVSIVFENERYDSDKNESKVRQRMDIAYVREQSEGETSDAKKSTRMFHTYTLYLFQKPFKGDIESLLQENFVADSDNVPEAERELIRTKLREMIKRKYPDITNVQLKLQL